MQPYFPKELTIQSIYDIMQLNQKGYYMYSFEWDERKSKVNAIKHGVTFEEAQTVFYDEYALIEYDADHSSEEDRFRILGSSIKGNVLLVVHCIKEGGTIRIISSRKATAAERTGYENLRIKL